MQLCYNWGWRFRSRKKINLSRCGNSFNYYPVGYLLVICQVLDNFSSSRVPLKRWRPQDHIFIQIQWSFFFTVHHKIRRLVQWNQRFGARNENHFVKHCSVSIYRLGTENILSSAPTEENSKLWYLMHLKSSKFVMFDG